MPLQCHGVLVMSPHAHARIKNIDTAAAKAAPGVLAVLTGADAEADKIGSLVPIMPEDMGGPKGYRTLRPILSSGKVRAVGDRVAFVVAETLQQARDAAELIAVDYEPLPAVGCARGRGQAGRAGDLGRRSQQCRRRADDGRQGGDRRRLRRAPSTWCRSSSSTIASAPIRSSRAPRSANTIPTARATRSTPPRRTRTGTARMSPATC